MEISIILILSLVVSSQSIELLLYDYCVQDGNHLMCRWKKNGWSRECRLRVMTDQRRRHTLYTLNRLRNEVACYRHIPGSPTTAFVNWYYWSGHRWKADKYPPASNMRKLVWDRELELFAERILSQCFGRSVMNQNVNHDTTRFETTLLYEFTDNDKEKPMDAVTHLFSTDTVRPSGSVAHGNLRDYRNTAESQLFYSEAMYVGCAWGEYFNQYYINTTRRRDFVCFIGPKGPKAGEALYKIGPPASECHYDSKPDPNYHGLCRYALWSGCEAALPSRLVMMALPLLLSSSAGVARSQL